MIEPRCLALLNWLFGTAFAMPLDMTKELRKACRTPAKGRDGVTNIPLWKFDTVRAAVLDAVASSGNEGFLFKDLPNAVRERLSSEDLGKLGSLGWHVTTVKLEMEVAGEIKRLNGKGPQRLVID